MDIKLLPREDRLGQKVKNRHGVEMEIIEYRKNDDLDIKFESGEIIKHKAYSNFVRGLYNIPIDFREGNLMVNNQGSPYKILKIIKNKYEVTKYLIEFQDKFKYTRYSEGGDVIDGAIKNPYHPKIANKGYFGVGEYSNKNNTEIYASWTAMIKRCYSDKDHRWKAYGGRGVYVCEEWHNFQNFARWHEENTYECQEKLTIDKDILIKNNKVYSPNTCILVPERINKLFINTGKENGLPRGVHKRYNRYIASMSKGDGCVKLGSYLNLEEAFESYKREKEEYIKEIADLYKDIIPYKLYIAMYNYEIEIND